jgi:hypothetical protein
MTKRTPEETRLSRAAEEDQNQRTENPSPCPGGLHPYLATVSSIHPSERMNRASRPNLGIHKAAGNILKTMMAEGYLGVIVPLSGFSTERMTAYRDNVSSRFRRLANSYHSDEAQVHCGTFACGKGGGASGQSRLFTPAPASFGEMGLTRIGIERQFKMRLQGRAPRRFCPGHVQSHQRRYPRGPK